MKKEIRFYNVLFPVWFLVLIPQMWLVVLPGNFIIDSLVLVISMHCLHMTDKKTFYKKHIWWIFGFGLLADAIGSGFLLLMLVLEWASFGDELYFTIPAVVLSGAIIYALNYFVTFRRCEKFLRHRLALIYAIVTAPYTFLIPVSWIY